MKIHDISMQIDENTIVMFSSATVLEFSTGIIRLFFDSPLSERATVYTPCRGEYCPVSNDALVGAQFAAFA